MRLEKMTASNVVQKFQWLRKIRKKIFSNLLPQVSTILTQNRYIRKMYIATNNWDVETYKTKLEKKLEKRSQIKKLF